MLIKPNIYLSLLLFILTGCTFKNAAPALEQEETARPAIVVTSVTTTEIVTPEATKTPVERELSIRPVPTPTNHSDSASATLESGEQTAEQDGDESARILSEVIPPVRDDIRLAQAYRGFTVGEDPNQPQLGRLPSVGSRQPFRIFDVVNNTIGEIEAELVAQSDHAYFWFDTDPGSPIPAQAEVQEIAREFDAIYQNVVTHFGPEDIPGIDGDPRLHVVNASATALCGVTEENAGACYLAGLVQPSDTLPAAVDPRSNEREMFVMNAHRFGTASYLGVLAHEFRHMIEDNYDLSDTDWEKEGSATLAAQLAGYPSGGIERGNSFLQNPDQQLNSWTEDDTGPYYGQGYLLNQYIYDRLGEDLYRQFATNPLPGLKAVDAVAEANNLNIRGESLWLDWLVTLMIHDDPNSDDIYRFEPEGIETAAYITIDKVPAEFREQVSQYAADYYKIPPEAREIVFSGDEAVSLLGVEPASGDRYWFAQRGNNSNPRLTRAVDLRGVEKATLNYQVYADIERGYDFAYVSVSVDGGETWNPLVGEHMQGEDPADNPSGAAFADRFYTGRIKQWVEEQIDLSAYAGQKILLRFEYVTDPILTYGGLALDDIAVPEIGFFDDAESTDLGWQPEGFVRTAATLPQQWHLLLITFTEEGPSVASYDLDRDGMLSISLPANDLTDPAVLIVAAAAPTTLEAADYVLSVR